jgi:Ca2+-binding RTX toxin-like protein
VEEISHLVNTGLILVEGALGAIGCDIEWAGLDGWISNDGWIEAISHSTESIGIKFNGASERFLANSGVIVADIAIDADDKIGNYGFTAGVLNLTNSGTLVGRIEVGSSADRVVNTGSILGPVNLGAGADMFDGSKGLQTGPINGEAGADILIGGLHDDILSGGDGDDVITGGFGDDIIDGGAGNDTLIVSGDAADYRLLMNGDDFILKGPDGGDRLTGVETIRFGDGRVLELNRMYGPDIDSGAWADGRIPEALLSPLSDDQPLVLPGTGAIDGKTGDLPLVLPDEEAARPFPGLEARLAGSTLFIDIDGELGSQPLQAHPDWM